MKFAPGMAVLAAALAWTAPAAAGVDEFRPYAALLVDRLVIGIEHLEDAIESGDLDSAKAAWIAVRPAWETGETFYGEFFPEYDEAMDIWPDADNGFHAIERALFEEGDLGKAAGMVEVLERNGVELRQAFAKTDLTAQGLLNGTAGIAFEVGAGKADGGESPFSGNSLADMQNNLDGIEAAYALAFAPTVSEKAPELHERIVGQLAELEAELAVARLADLDREHVVRLSEELALSLSDAARPLGLQAPAIGG